MIHYLPKNFLRNMRALLFLLLMLSEEEIKGFMEKLYKQIHELEHKEVT